MEADLVPLTIACAIACKEFRVIEDPILYILVRNMPFFFFFFFIFSFIIKIIFKMFDHLMLLLLLF
jgi:hypothetical protein